MKKLLLLGVCVFAGANAALIPALNPVDLSLGVGGSQIVLEGSGQTAYSYSYTATLNEQARFNGDPDNEYFVLYDFPGFLSVRSIVPGPAAAWEVTYGNIPASFPPGITSDNGGPVDDPSTQNLVFRYVGPGAPGGSAWTFDVASSVGSGFALSYFTSSAANGRLDGTFVRNWGNVLVPAPGGDDNPIPEPLTMGLLGAGLAGMGLLKRFKN